jgi:hypothetical protein
MSANNGRDKGPALGIGIAELIEKDIRISLYASQVTQMLTIGIAAHGPEGRPSQAEAN